MKMLFRIIKSIIGIILSIALIIVFVIVAKKLSTMNKKFFVNEEPISISIFTYHEVVDDSAHIKQDFMQISESKFEKQITGLKYIGFNAIKYRDLIDYSSGDISLYPYNYIITFDDGYESVYEYAYPIIKSREIPITLFVIDEKIGTEGYLNWNQLKEMEESGLVDVYTHGLDHEDSTKLEPRELLNRVNKAQDNLVSRLGNRPQIFAYPYGKYTEEQFELLKENGYIQNLMDDQTNISDKMDLYKLHRSYAYNDSLVELVAKQIIRGL